MIYFQQVMSDYDPERAYESAENDSDELFMPRVGKNAAADFFDVVEEMPFRYMDAVKKGISEDAPDIEKFIIKLASAQQIETIYHPCHAQGYLAAYELLAIEAANTKEKIPTPTADIVNIIAIRSIKENSDTTGEWDLFAKTYGDMSYENRDLREYLSDYSQIVLGLKGKSDIAFTFGAVSCYAVVREQLLQRQKLENRVKNLLEKDPKISEGTLYHILRQIDSTNELTGE